MNPGRSEILTLLRLISLKSYDEVTDIAIQNILKYSQPFELTDDLQIPYVGYVKSLISDGTGAVKTLTFSQSDLVSDGGGGYYLPINLTGTQITIAMKSTSGYRNAGGDVENINGFTDNSNQTITVFVVGEADEFIAFKNFSSQSVEYAIDEGDIGIIMAGETINIPLPSVLSLRAVSDLGGYGLVNQTNTLLDRIGGGRTIDTVMHAWNIPSNSTLLNIAGIP